MHKFIEKMLPHIIILFALLFLPPQIAAYLFVVLYIIGVFINLKKEKNEALEKNKDKKIVWWEVLGTTPDASIKDCTRLRKLLTKIYHPDGGEMPNLEAMRRINEAFAERASKPDAAREGIIH